MSDFVVKRKALSEIRAHTMLSKGDRVLVAVSGGADSMTLLSVLLELQEEIGLSEIAAVHVNHGLRPGEADRDEALVREYCQREGVRLFVQHVDVTAEATHARKGIEETGRDLRYALFDSLAIEHGFHHVATAHTHSDAMETVLLHLARGTGIEGLKGIPPVRGRIIRPLLGCTRAEIEEYCREHSLAFCEDSTNSDIHYSRNRIRQCIIPEFYALNPRVDEAFARVMRIAEQDEAYWQQQVHAAITDATILDGVFSAIKLQCLSSALRGRVLRRLVCEYTGIQADEAQIRRIEHILHDGGGVSLRTDTYVSVKQGYFTFKMPVSAIEPSCRLLEDGQNYDFGDNIYHCEVLERENFEKQQRIHKKLLQYACDYDKIIGVASVRTRLPGDAYSPYRRGGRKTLKKWMNAERVPELLRDRIPLIVDKDGIVLVVGLGCDERVAIDEHTRRFLTFYKIENRK